MQDNKYKSWKYSTAHLWENLGICSITIFHFPLMTERGTYRCLLINVFSVSTLLCDKMAYLIIVVIYIYIYMYQSVSQFSHPVLSSSLRPRGLQHGQASLSITNPWSLLKLISIESVILSNHLILCHPLLLLPSIFPASGSFPMSQFFPLGGRSIEVSASASVLSMNTQD